MNNEWIGKTIKKKIRSKKSKLNSKNQSEQKLTSKKANFCSNSLYCKIGEQSSRRKSNRFFTSFPVSALPKSRLQFDFKNHEKSVNRS